MAETATDDRAWLLEELSSRLNAPAADIDPRAPLTRYGMNSIESASLASALEQRLGRAISSGFFLEFASLEDAVSECLRLRQTP